jgi:hypothetical protein
MKSFLTFFDSLDMKFQIIVFIFVISYIYLIYRIFYSIFTDTSKQDGLGNYFKNKKKGGQ